MTLFLMLVVLIAAAAASVASAAAGPLVSAWTAADSVPPSDRQFTPDQVVGILGAAEQTAPNPAAAGAITFAAAQLGLPYVWGGNGPAHGDAGYDCSGLVKAAYASIGITLPRTATDQYWQGTSVPLTALKPGDLVFYGNDDFAHHVAIYVGQIAGIGVILDAPKTGAFVRLDPLVAGDLFAATRPAVGR